MTKIEAEASAPASSANLGPGFDCLAIALEIRCRVKARRSEKWEVRHVGFSPAPFGIFGRSVGRRPVGGGDRTTALHGSGQPDPRSCSGLGSSAAAYTAGMVAASRFMEESVASDQVFQKVAALEGHPDNAAAAVFGGLVMVGDRGQGSSTPIE